MNNRIHYFVAFISVISVLMLMSSPINSIGAYRSSGICSNCHGSNQKAVKDNKVRYIKRQMIMPDDGGNFYFYFFKVNGHTLLVHDGGMVKID